MKKTAIFLALIFAGVGSQATAQSAIEKALKDPARKANEAKADRRVMDSTSKTVVVSDTTATATKPAVKRKKQGKCCARKSKKSS